MLKLVFSLNASEYCIGYLYNFHLLFVNKMAVNDGWRRLGEGGKGYVGGGGAAVAVVRVDGIRMARERS